MPPFGGMYNPANVMMGRGSSGPYMWTGSDKPGPQPPIRTGTAGGWNPTAPVTPPSPMPPDTGTLGSESIRATGKGPFDQAYRQNLATYAGGQFSRPGGSMSFNPTDMTTFPGQPTGGGTAPVAGMPRTLADMALGGQGFSWTPPTETPSTSVPAFDFQSLQDWMNEFLKNGRSYRMGGDNA